MFDTFDHKSKWSEFFLQVMCSCSFVPLVFRRLYFTLHWPWLYKPNETIPLKTVTREHFKRTSSKRTLISGKCPGTVGIMNAFLYLICHYEKKTTRTHRKQTTKYLTSLEISEIRVSLSSYCSFKMPSKRASTSTDLKIRKKKQWKIQINWSSAKTIHLLKWDNVFYIYIWR